MYHQDNFEHESSEDENKPFNPYIDADYEPDDIPVPLNIYNQSPQSKPKPFKVYDVQLPSINYKDMPDLLANRIHDIAKIISAPPEYAYTSIMIMIAVAIGTKLGLRPKRNNDDYFICSLLWGLNIGETGTKKTPVQHLCMQKLNSLNLELFEECQKAISAFKKQKSKLEKQIARIQNGHDSADAMAGLIDQLQDLLDNEPAIESIVINDGTKEALQKDTGHSKNGILFEMDEIAELFEQIDASKNGYRQYLLTSWNGVLPRRSSRVGTGHNNVTRTFISILGGIQPDKLALFMKNGKPKYGSDGFISRFQMAFLPTPLRSEYKDEKGNAEYEEQLNDVIEFMFKWKPEDDPNYSSYRNYKDLLSISFDEEAQLIFAEWTQALDNRIFDKKDSARLRDHLNKYDALMGKIALIYHVIEHAPTTAFS
jgi:putative DNA primase/helicase